MCSWPSSVAAQTTATSASDPLVRFHGSTGEIFLSLLGAWHRGKRSILEIVDQIQTKISSPGRIAEGVQVPTLKTSSAHIPSTGLGPQKRAHPQLATNPKSAKSPIVPIGAPHPKNLAGAPWLVGEEMGSHPQRHLTGPSSRSQGTATVISTESRATIETSIRGIEQTDTAPSPAADGGTMASPSRPIVVDSDTPPWLGRLSES